MIHNAYSVIDGQGEDVLESINERQVELFVAKTGMRKDKVKKMLEDETFLSAQEAYDMGFADKVFDPLKMAAQLNQMKPMEEVMSQPATEEVVVAEEVAEVVAAADPGDEQPEKEEVEVEVPVTAVEAVQAALRGHLKAKVNVSARYGAIVAELTSEVKSLRAQLDEANAAVEATEAKAAGAEQAQEAAAAAEAAAQEAQAQVEQLKATPLEEPIKSDAAPTAVVPGAPVKPTMSPASAHAQRMAQTLDRLDRKLGIKKD
jgi:hypothetical protein